MKARTLAGLVLGTVAALTVPSHGAAQPDDYPGYFTNNNLAVCPDNFGCISGNYPEVGEINGSQGFDFAGDDLSWYPFAGGWIYGGDADIMRNRQHGTQRSIVVKSTTGFCRALRYDSRGWVNAGANHNHKFVYLRADDECTSRRDGTRSAGLRFGPLEVASRSG